MAEVDEFGPLYRQVADDRDGTAWRQIVQQARLPSVVASPQDVQSLVADIAPRYGVDPRLMQSIMGLESGGNAAAVSRKGAQGLMQLMPATGRRFGVTDPLNPQQNLEGGARYLSFLANQFPGRLDLQLAAYHAGEGAVRHAGYQVPDTHDGNMSTAQYVSTVLGRYQGARGVPPGSALVPPQGTQAMLGTGGPTPELDAQARAATMAPTPPGPDLPLLGEQGGPQSPLQAETDLGRSADIAPLRTAEGIRTGAAPPGMEPPQVQGPPTMLAGEPGLVNPLGTELHTPASARAASQAAAGVPAPGAGGPGDRTGPLEPGLVEPRIPRILGTVAAGVVDIAKGLFRSAEVAQVLTGVKQPGQPDRLHAGAVADALDQASKAVEGRAGGTGPDFVDNLSRAVGTSLGSLVPAAAVGQFLRGVGRLGTAGPLVSKWGSAIAGGVIEGLGESSDLYGQLKPLVGEQTAAQRALKSFAANVVLVSITDKLGIFGDESKLFRRAFNGIVTNGLQEGVQYDIENKLMWLPAELAGAHDMLAQGWQQQGDRIVKPFDVKDAAQAVAIGMIIGGPAAAAAGAHAGELSTPWHGVVERETAAAGGVIHPEFSIMTALDAAQHPTTPRAGVDLETWQRWGNYIKDILPAGGGGILSQTMGGQTGAIGGDRQSILRQRSQANQLLQALEAGGERAQTVVEALQDQGVTTPEQAQDLVRGRIDEMNTTLAALPAEPTPVPSEAPAAVAGQGPQPTLTGQAPTLEAGAQGIPQEAYRRSDGRLVAPLKDLPSTELELQDFIWQPPRNGIKLKGETDVPGELAQRISVPAVGRSESLQNNVSGLTLQQMAETAQQHGFIRTADKQALLEALDRSLLQGKPVYSEQATGTISILDDPHVRMSYQAVTDAIAAMKTATEELVGGVEHRATIHEEAQMFPLTREDIPRIFTDLLPQMREQTVLTSALVQGLNTVSEEMATAAQRFLDTGARVGSREEASLQQTMALLAQLDPYRLGLSARASRNLGILNDPLSGYTQYLNALHKVLETSGPQTMERIAQKILSARPDVIPEAQTQEYWRTHPEELDAIFAKMHEEMQQFLATREPLRLTPEGMSENELALSFGQLSAEEQAKIQAAYSPQGPPRTPEEWTAMWRASQDTQWRASMAQLQQEQAQRRAGYEGRPVSLSPEDAAFYGQRTPTQGMLPGFEEARADQEALTAWLQGHASADQQERIDNVLRPWKQGEARVREGQEGLSPDLMRALRDFQQTGNITAAQLKDLRTEQQRAAFLEYQKGTIGAMVQSQKPGFEQYFLELWFNALLSNPATHLANTISNTSTAIWAIPERYIAEQYGFGREGHVVRGEAEAMLYGLVHGIQDSWTGAYRSFQLGQPISGLGREYAREPANTAANYGVNPDSPFGKSLDFFFNYIGALSGGRLPSKFLMAADEFMKMLNYRSQLNALAYREASRQGYEGSAWGDHVSRVITSPQLGEIQQASQEFAVLQTFQNEMQPGALGKVLGGVSNWSPSFFGTSADLPVGRLLLPFVQTPLNIGRYAMERTPMGVFFRNFQADLQAGGTRADMANAKVAMGTMMMLGMVGYAMQGGIVGRGPEDPELREIWLESHREYSVRIPGTHVWVGINRLEPFGTLLSMVGDLYNIAGEAHQDMWVQALKAPFYLVFKNVGSKTFMLSATQFFDAMATPPSKTTAQFGDNVERFLFRQAAGMAQPSALLAATARVLSPEEVEAKDVMDQIYARVPGWRGDVPARRTLGGEKVLYGEGFGPDVLMNFVRAYSPAQLGDGQLYPVDKEMLANHMTINKPSRVLVPHALEAGTLANPNADLEGVPSLKLTDAQYERYAVLAAGNQREARKLGMDVPREVTEQLVEGLAGRFAATPPARVQSLDDYLDWAIKQPEYRAESPGPGGGKEALVKEAVRAYRDMGNKLLLAQDDELRQRFEESKTQQAVLKLPLGERPGAIQELRQGFQEAAPELRRDLGLQIGAPIGAGRGAPGGRQGAGNR